MFMDYSRTAVEWELNIRAEWRDDLQPHNLKVVGSNPTPATNAKPRKIKALARRKAGFCYVRSLQTATAENRRFRDIVV